MMYDDTLTINVKSSFFRVCGIMLCEAALGFVVLGSRGCTQLGS